MALDATEPSSLLTTTVTTIGTLLTILVVVKIISRVQNIGYYGNWMVIQAKYWYIGISAIIIQIIRAKDNHTDLPIMTGRIAIVTGGSRGIGLEVVKMLLKCDLEVVIACRDVSAGENAVEIIRKMGIETGKTRVMKLDNASLESVRSFVREFKSHYKGLNILINNAGIMFTPHKLTADGVEQQYGVNYLSHFYLTMLLIPLLEYGALESGHNSRIVNVSSRAHLLGGIDFKNMNDSNNFNTYEAYAQSKLAQVLCTKKLARRFEERKMPILINAVHPGMVETELFKHSFIQFSDRIKRIILRTPEEGATVIVYAAVSKRLEKQSGLYLSDCLDTKVNPIANLIQIQDTLFQLSFKQLIAK